jgi:hypothetical protein
MKKFFLVCFLIAIVQHVYSQWNGGPSTTGLAFRDGNVLVGGTALSGSYGPTERIFQLQGEGTWLSMVTPTGPSFHLGFSASYGASLYARGTPIKFWTSPTTSGLTERMTIAGSGEVGIGTPTPLANFHLSSGVTGKGELRIESDTDNNNENDNPFISFIQDGTFVGGFIGLVGDPNTAPHFPKYGASGNTVYAGTKSNALFIGTSFSENVQLGTNGIVRLTINENGNAIFKDIVAIGTPFTTNPNNYKLAVNGKIGAKEVQVENTSSTWADYVFEPDYKLLSLQEVESFVKANKHLPEIPSAEEVKINGHKLGEMDVLLLKKVEELTLYMIAMKKEIESLRIENENLSKEIDNMRK